MNKHNIHMALAGFCFAVYPLLLSRSKLPGNMAAVTFCFFVFVFTAPFAWAQRAEISHTYWIMMLGAAIFSAAGMLFMTGVLTSVPEASKATLIVMMAVVQTAATACYQLYIDGRISITRVMGFACAGIAIVLLNKK